MLSRLSLKAGSHGLAKNIVAKFVPVAAVTTSPSSTAAEPCERKLPSAGGASKRDLVNFPDRVKQDYPPPTRFLFIPEAFFQALYPKTGVTGPYVFFFGASTYLLSKEIVVIEHNFMLLLSWIGICTIANYKFGDKIAEAWNKKYKEHEDGFDIPQEKQKENVRKEIKFLEEHKNLKEVVSEIMKAKRENVLLQMEAAYRARMQEAYKKIKNRLDCQVEMEYVERRIAQRNLIDYVLKNVMKSITPEQEKNTLQNCIQQLNTLAAKA